ncbi:hypothetical protein PESP_a3866 [Pseudoalteromonas espejiana DSM 9414]|jgi:hypothetical protein|uniref:Uncharacterized protein n=1 Tax=Pseudoalteromonas espejiana TaxID=28107 RepID=A0A510Y2P4_9GAMM|nr:hypothetical protein [Pseudoalteromonas espejiana]ASM51612.1 hypothetical protein PESP_a3866 [Pseudoalteromonas espejiana DSM 9414]GEK56897.1 hypothetical protein PES01_37420 [Pseudoalteromonas espejiana]
MKEITLLGFVSGGSVKTNAIIATEVCGEGNVQSVSNGGFVCK